MIKLSFNILKLENKALSIIFKDLTLVTDLSGLKTLKVLRAFRSYSPKAD